MGGRVVEGTGLENRQARKRLVGSNPTPSAMLKRICVAKGNGHATVTLAEQGLRGCLEREALSGASMG